MPAGINVLPWPWPIGEAMVNGHGATLSGGVLHLMQIQEQTYLRWYET